MYTMHTETIQEMSLYLKKPVAKYRVHIVVHSVSIVRPYRVKYVL
jgi:hypothetical protein